MTEQIKTIDNEFLKKCLKISRVKQEEWDAFIMQKSDEVTRLFNSLNGQDTLRSAISIRDTITNWKKSNGEAGKQSDFVIAVKKNGMAAFTVSNDIGIIQNADYVLPACSKNTYSILYRSRSEGTTYAKSLKIDLHALKKEYRIIPENCSITEMLPGTDAVLQLDISSKTRRTRAPITVRFSDLGKRSICEKGFKVTSYPITSIRNLVEQAEEPNATQNQVGIEKPATNGEIASNARQETVPTASASNEAIQSNPANAEITIEKTVITPEQAQDILDKANATSFNRRSNQHNIEKYVQQMKEGKWITGMVDIAFDVNGRLINGHHVCEAIVKSGLSQTVTIKRNLPVEAVMLFDMPDSSRDLQEQFEFYRNHHVNSTMYSILRQMINLVQKDKKKDIDAMSEFYDQNHSIIDECRTWINHTIPCRKLFCATITLILLKDKNSIKHKTELKRFCDLFINKEENRNKPTSKLYEQLLSVPSSKKKFVPSYIIQAWNTWARDRIKFSFKDTEFPENYDSVVTL